IGIDEVLAVVGGGDGVGGIAGIERAHADAIQADAVEVGVVAVLAGLVAVGGEVHRGGGVVHALDVAGDEFAFVHLALEGAVGAVEVVVAPAVALAKDQQLVAVVGELQRLSHDVDVGALLDHRLHGAVGGVDRHVVHLVHIAADAHGVEFGGGAAQPDRRWRLAVGGGVALVVGHGIGLDGEALILEGVHLDLGALLAGHVEDPHLVLGHVGFARHGVLVGFERRPRVVQGVDHPQVGDLALVGAHQGEFARILRPNDAHAGLARMGAGVALIVGGSAAAAAPAPAGAAAAAGGAQILGVVVLHGAAGGVVGDAIGGELGFLDVGVVDVLQGQRIAGGVHHVEVRVAAEEDGLAVGRDGRPGRLALGLLVVAEQLGLPAGEVELEIDIAHAGGGRRGSVAAAP